MRDLDQYRSMDTTELLIEAREEGINPDMAVAMAERLEHAQWYERAHPSLGGRYTFNQRSIA